MRRLYPAYLSCLVLLLLTAVATAVSFQKEKAGIQSRFDQVASQRQQLISRAFTDKLLVVESMQSVFGAINDVPSPEFGNMADPFQKAQPGIDGFRWIAAVAGAGSALLDFESGLASAYPAFRAWERAPSGGEVPVLPRPVHYLVMPQPDGTIDPLAGFDLASSEAAADAIGRAVESGRVALSAQVAVPASLDQQSRRLMAFAPVFRKAGGVRGELIGLIAGLFNIPVVVQNALGDLEPASLSLRLLDMGSEASPDSLYQSLDVQTDGESGFWFYRLLRPNAYVAGISLGGRPWSLRVEPGAAFVRGQGISSTLIILLCGLAMALIVPPYFAVHILKEARLAESQARLRETQVQLLHAQKLELVGEMTSGIAHDFNNVLHAVTIQADLAKALLPSRDDARLDEALQSIKDAATSGSGLVGKLSGFARSNRRQAATADLTRLLRDSATLLRPLMGSAIELQINAADNCWSAVDDTDFQQVVLNLGINARDAIQASSSRYGLVTIDLAVQGVGGLACVSCGKAFRGEYVVLKVTDNGSGISAQSLQRMFDPFYTTKAHGKGTGLGLAIVHSVVHEAGGHIGVDTSAGEGTIFTVYFPADAGPASGGRP